MNRAELIEITRKAIDGTTEAEEALNHCKQEARNGRGASHYFMMNPKEHTLNIIRSAGLDVVIEAEDNRIRITWDTEAETSFQSRNNRQQHPRESSMSEPTVRAVNPRRLSL